MSKSLAAAHPTADPQEALLPCQICQRTFLKASLVKHEAACQKLHKSRKVFDSGKQRATGSDVPLSSVRKAQQEYVQNQGKFSTPQTRWRERHQHFLNAVQSSRGVERALKTGSPLPPPPPRQIPSDYVKCECCGRSFNHKAAERHIPFCKEQNSRLSARLSLQSSKMAHSPAARRSLPGSTVRHKSPAVAASAARRSLQPVQGGRGGGGGQRRGNVRQLNSRLQGMTV